MALNILSPLLGTIHGYSQTQGIPYDWKTTATYVSIAGPITWLRAIDFAKSDAIKPTAGNVLGLFVFSFIGHGALICAGNQVGKSLGTLMIGNKSKDKDKN